MRSTQPLLQMRIHRAKTRRDAADLDPSPSVSPFPRAGDALPAQHIAQHGAPLQSLALRAREGWQAGLAGRAGRAEPRPGTSPG